MPSSITSGSFCGCDCESAPGRVQVSSLELECHFGLLEVRLACAELTASTRPSSSEVLQDLHKAEFRRQTAPGKLRLAPELPLLRRASLHAAGTCKDFKGLHRHKDTMLLGSATCINAGCRTVEESLPTILRQDLTAARFARIPALQN